MLSTPKGCVYIYIERESTFEGRRWWILSRCHPLEVPHKHKTEYLYGLCTRNRNHGLGHILDIWALGCFYKLRLLSVGILVRRALLFRTLDFLKLPLRHSPSRSIWLTDLTQCLGCFCGMFLLLCWLLGLYDVPVQPQRSILFPRGYSGAENSESFEACRRSKYPIFEASGSEHHTLNGIWGQRA